MTDLTTRILEAFACDDCDELFWRTDGEYAPITFSVMCNDLFYWGCADLELIAEENIELLEATKAELKATFPLDYYWWTVLFCCRSRKMRPQKPYYKSIPVVLHPLFNACGPERTE